MLKNKSNPKIKTLKIGEILLHSFAREYHKKKQKKQKNLILFYSKAGGETYRLLILPTGGKIIN